jgi:hypothetical protein
MGWGGWLGAQSINFLSGCTVLSISAVSLLRSRKTGVRLETGRGTALAAGAVLGGVGGRVLFAFAVIAAHKSIVGAIQSAVLIIMTIGIMAYTHKKQVLPEKHPVPAGLRRPGTGHGHGIGLFGNRRRSH